MFTLHYIASEKLRRQEFVDSGEAGPSWREIELDLTGATPEQRQAFVFLHGLRDTNGKNDASYAFDAVPSQRQAIAAVVTRAAEQREKRRIRLSEKANRAIRRARDAIEARRVISSLQSLSVSEAEDAEALGIDLSEYDALLGAYRSSEATFIAEAEARKAEAQEKRERQKEAKAQERLDWINANGSDHLKSAVSAGYDCQRLYATERAAMEYPAYVLDFDNDAYWNDRSCPTPEALAEAGRVGGTVVWMTTDGGQYDSWFEECEAVVIRFLDRYCLYRTF